YSPAEWRNQRRSVLDQRFMTRGELLEVLGRQEQPLVPLNRVGYFVSVHHHKSFSSLGSLCRRAWFRRFFKCLYAKIFFAKRDQNALARIDHGAVCACVEIVGEDNAAGGFV